MRLLTSIILIFSACRAAKNKGDTASDDSGAWWTQDTASDDSNDTDESDDEFDDEDFEPGTYYYGVVDVASWAEGYFVHESFDEDGKGCIIEGAMIDTSTPGSCSDCAIDMTATIVGLEVVEDLGACEDSESIIQSFEGLEVAYGQGIEPVFEEEGFTFYELYELGQDSWNGVENGFSLTGLDEESGLDLWGFYIFLE